MANEINIQAVLTVQKYTPPLLASGSATGNQTGAKFAQNTVNVTTSANSNLTIDGSANLGFIFVKNLDTNPWNSSNYVDIALDNGSPPTQIVSKLHAGEFCLLRVKGSTNTLYARATGVAADVQFSAAQV